MDVEELFQAQTHLYKYTYSFVASMCLKSAVNLGIPDAIFKNGKPITLSELVLALQIQPTKSGHVYRLMRLLVHAGFFATTKVVKDDKEEVGYDLTPSSRLLLKDNVPTLSPFVRAMFHPAIVHSSESLPEWFHRNETTPCDTAFGMSFWEYLSQNQEFNGLFNEAMVSDSGMVNLVMKNCKSVFEGLNSLVDVGGGKGGVGRIVCESLPNLQWTVLDLPHVVENLPDSTNLKFVGGDMFQSIPPADAVLLKLVLHAYSDEECIKVLKKCKEAVSKKGKTGKVIIIDIVVGQKNENHELTEAKLFFDMITMVVVTGREREEKEWEKLFLEAGFSHYKITNIFGMRSLIEVYP
ncbi:isoflavone 4'-O-methyltransferase-like isoform X1 [Vigna umbellata]|uniref:isoflavone 4'-O-methyltransferase-like isoform X1 n=1 Tax=Vigna umbellata TaxID=87088 RepID=UPI001F5EC8F4|nr:isoflavone 4'-O-methyltransferase-like isoform X1 [Vigna umbellata]